MTQSLQIAEQLCRSREPKNVLLVEDSAQDAELALHILNEGGCIVKLCRSGESAIAAVRFHKFDLAILDIQLIGGMDGLEAAKAIRKIDPDLPIVISSGSYGNPNLIAVMQEGYVVMPKPFSIAKIRALATGVGIFK